MDLLIRGLMGSLLLAASLLIGVVVAVEAVLIVSLLTMPLVSAVGRWLPWRRAAERRAEALLRSMLSREEFNCLCLRGYLEVPSPSRPERTYRIPRVRSTVDVYEKGRYHSTLCIAPIIALPDDDVVLAHKLMILADETRYLATANRVAGARWEEPASALPPPRPSDRKSLVRLLAGTLAATLLVAFLLHLAGLSNARDVVLAVVVGWPVVIAVISTLAGLAVLLMGAATQPRLPSRGDRTRRFQ